MAETAAADHAELTRVVAIINGKGGVGKTTLTANVGGLLAREHKVLLIDLDPAGGLGVEFGYADTDLDDEGRGLAQALMFGGTLQPVKNIRPGLDVVPGGVALEDTAAGLNTKAGRDPRAAKLSLARSLAPIADDYDFIFLDCPPGDAMLQTIAAAAARWALIPIKSDAGSIRAVETVAMRLEEVVEVNPNLDLLGVVLVATNRNARTIHDEVFQGVSALFDGDRDVMFEPLVGFAESSAVKARKGVPMYELDERYSNAPKWYQIARGEATKDELIPASVKSVTDDLYAVTAEVVRRITKAESADVTEGSVA